MSDLLILAAWGWPICLGLAIFAIWGLVLAIRHELGRRRDS